ncbi:ABC transporter ATP-binding protein [Rickettsia endosymbiont of Halotydeus destructor]|uniref:ABC transporter ATP-binding protein n=1 Tax=Rickettsia endosymbiont of Halotydeus destructor TaxID=2996754 RepID=UPI003BAF96A8
MKNSNIINFIYEVCKPFKWLILGQFTVAIVWAIDMSLRPYILKLMLDKIPLLNADNVASELSGLMVFYLSMSLGVSIIWRFIDYTRIKLKSPLKRHITDTLMNKMMQHSQTLFQNHFAGSLANKVKDVMNNIPDLIDIVILQFFGNFIAVVISIFTVWTINYKFSLLLGIWVVIFTLSAIYFSKRARELSKKSSETHSKVVGYVVDILSNIVSVHLFASKRMESRRLGRQLDEYVQAHQKRDWWFLYMFAFQSILFIVYQIIGFVLLISGFKEGSVTLGDFALLITLNISIVDILWALSRDILNFAKAIGETKQGLDIVLTPMEIADKPDSKALKIKEGKITFDKVKFQYKNTAPLFQNKSVIIKAGEKVGLVGYSGSGKTTFVNLILRMYDINEGSIFIDDQNIASVTQESLRSNIGVIPQEASLFHRSLMENIRYGRLDASDEEVIEAAKKAHAHEFIERLPEQYESLVGERGVKLSGGQRQRIAIARAILKNAPILILDEATSQLDSVTESYIQESLWNLMQGKTTIVIAHRLSTLLHMDRILVFDKGKIVEDGEHGELLTNKKLYKILWNAQIGGFLPERI